MAKTRIAPNPEIAEFTGPNATEREFVRRAKHRGWRVLRHGWPDFLLVKQLDQGFEFCAVEVKQDHDTDVLREGQRLMLASLALQGIPCFIWSGQDQTLRRIQISDAQRTMTQYFQRIDSSAVRAGLKELQALGVKIRWY